MEKNVSLIVDLMHMDEVAKVLKEPKLLAIGTTHPSEKNDQLIREKYSRFNGKYGEDLNES